MSKSVKDNYGEIISKQSFKPVKVKMVAGKGKDTRSYNQTISGFHPLGKKVTIGARANVTLNKPGFKVEFYTETVSCLIAIGKNHTMELIMTVDTWEQLKSGTPISTETTKEFFSKYLKSK